MHILATQKLHQGHLVNHLCVCAIFLGGKFSDSLAIGSGETRGWVWKWVLEVDTGVCEGCSGDVGG